MVEMYNLVGAPGSSRAAVAAIRWLSSTNMVSHRAGNTTDSSSPVHARREHSITSHRIVTPIPHLGHLLGTVPMGSVSYSLARMEKSAYAAIYHKLEALA